MSSTLNCEMNFYLMLINQNNQQITAQRVILCSASIDISFACAFQNHFFSLFLMTSYTKIELRTP